VSGGEHPLAADLWSLGCVVYQVLTGVPALKDVKQVRELVNGSFEFPVKRLQRVGVSATGTEFVQHLLTMNPEVRPTTADAIGHQWLLTTHQDISVSEHTEDDGLWTVDKPVGTASEPTLVPTSVQQEQDSKPFSNPFSMKRLQKWTSKVRFPTRKRSHISAPNSTSAIPGGSSVDAQVTDISDQRSVTGVPDRPTRVTWAEPEVTVFERGEPPSSRLPTQLQGKKQRAKLRKLRRRDQENHQESTDKEPVSGRPDAGRHERTVVESSDENGTSSSSNEETFKRYAPDHLPRKQKTWSWARSSKLLKRKFGLGMNTSDSSDDSSLSSSDISSDYTDDDNTDFDSDDGSFFFSTDSDSGDDADEDTDDHADCESDGESDRPFYIDNDDSDEDGDSSPSSSNTESDTDSGESFDHEMLFGGRDDVRAGRARFRVGGRFERHQVG
jgi:hypothetical protein